MGLFGWLGKKDEGDAQDRCNECGMVGGRHTEWCPIQAEEEAEVPSGAGRHESSGSGRPMGSGGEEHPRP